MPLRPVLSMPGSAYYRIAKEVTSWLSLLPECQINCSTKEIVDSLKDAKLEKGEILISFDVVSLYTNVSVTEAIEVCANLLFDRCQLPVDKNTFIELARLASCDVVMSTPEGYYKQVDGLAMGSPCAPLLANGWLSQYDPHIKDNAKLYFRYMDDIFREIDEKQCENKLAEINNYHSSLAFTAEKEEGGELPFLDCKLINHDGFSN